jgi:hypothetical protein
MQNPWLELPTQSPYILEMDRKAIDQYNQAHHNEDEKVIVGSIPEPFIGNPQSAKVVLLSLNPGHSEDDAKAHSDGDFRKAMMHNLRHEAQECPFYGLNPKFAWTACGIWWWAHTRRLHEAGLSWEAISNRLLVIEWFPYHSKRSALPSKPVCPSQEYSFQLAKEMLRSKIVVGMRSRKHWLNVVPAVQNVFASTSVLRDLVDQHRDLGHWRIHPVQQAQFEGHRYLLESLRPVRLDLPIFDLRSC